MREVEEKPTATLIKSYPHRRLMDTPPVPEKKEHLISLHGETWNDPYFWLRNKEDPEVIKYLEAENEFTNYHTRHTEKLREDMFEEMKGRINEDDQTVPTKEGGYLYYSRTETGKDYRIYCRRLDMDGSPEEIILDDISRNRQTNTRNIHLGLIYG